MPASGGEGYFALAMEGGYGPDSGPSRGGVGRGAIRPIEASTAAIRNGCFTSILLTVETGQADQVWILRPPWPTWRRFAQARTKPKLHSLIALVVTIIILVLVLGLLRYVLNLFRRRAAGKCSSSGRRDHRSAGRNRDPARHREHADRRRAHVRHGSRRMSWSNPQVVGKVAGKEIVAELGDGLGPRRARHRLADPRLRTAPPAPAIRSASRMGLRRLFPQASCWSSSSRKRLRWSQPARRLMADSRRAADGAVGERHRALLRRAVGRRHGAGRNDAQLHQGDVEQR